MSIMASSKSKIVKHLKAVGKYEASEISEALDSLKEDEGKQLSNLVKTLHTKLQGVSTEKVAGPRQHKAGAGHVTKEQKFEVMIEKIKKNLDKYEADASVDVWDTDFPVGDSYDDKSFEEIKTLHSRLVKTTASAEKIKMLSMSELGKMYDWLKYESENRHGTWEESCNQLSVCIRTADRYRLTCFNCLAFVLGAFLHA